MNVDDKSKLKWHIEMMRGYSDRAAHYQTMVDRHPEDAEYRRKLTLFTRKANERYQLISDIIDKL